VRYERRDPEAGGQVFALRFRLRRVKPALGRHSERIAERGRVGAQKTPRGERNGISALLSILLLVT
jgi:hypothetical protein